MKSKFFRNPLWMFTGLLVLVLSVVLTACGNSGSPTPTGDPIEQAMQTLQAQATQQYFQTVVAQLSATPPVIENTPTFNPTSINQVPTESPPTTEAPTATATQIPPTATQPAPTAIPPTPTATATEKSPEAPTP